MHNEINKKYNNQIKKLLIVLSIVFVSFTFASTLIMNEIFGTTSSTKNNDNKKFLSGTNATDVNWGKIINATITELNQTENIKNKINENFTFH